MSRALRVQRMVVYRSGNLELHVAMAAQTRAEVPEHEREGVAALLHQMVDSMAAGHDHAQNQTAHDFRRVVDETNASGFQEMDDRDRAPGFAVAHGFIACAARHHDLEFAGQGAYVSVDGTPTLSGFVGCVFGENADAFRRAFSIFRQARTGPDPI